MAGETIVQRLVSLLQVKTDDKALAATNKVLDGIKGKLTALAAVAAPAALAGYGAKLLGEAATAADVAAKTARTIGITTESYQELTQAAAFSGVKSEELNVALRVLSKNAYEAANGNKELNKTFKALNINAKDLAKLKPDQQIEKLADAYTKIEDPGKRAALMMKLLEEAGPKFASMFAGGGAGIAAMRKDAQDLGMIVPDNLAVKAEAFNDSMDRLRLIGQGMKFNFILQLLESIQPILDDLTAWRKKDAKAFSASLKELARTINGMIKDLHSGLKTLREWTEALGGAGNAVKLFALAAGSLLAARYLIQLGKGAQLLTLANLKLAASSVLAAAPYIILAGVIAGLFLIVEDFVGFVRGEDSLLGEFVGPATPEMLEDIKAGMIGILAVVGIIALIVGAIPIAIVALVGILAVAAATLIANWEEVKEGIVYVFESLYDSAVETWDSMIQALKDAFTNVYTWLEDGWDGLVNGMSERFMSMINKVKGVVGDVVSFIESPFDSVAGMIGGGAATPAVDMAAGSMRMANSRPQQNNTVNVQIDGAGLSEDALQRATTAGVNDAMLREADRAFRDGPGGS
jgi:hypothetical protein